MPARTWADRAADGLVLVGAAAAGWACASHAGTASSALVGGAALLVMLAVKTASRPDAAAGVLEHRPDGRWDWHSAAGRVDPVEPGGGCRRFGATVVLHVVGVGGRRFRTAWITPLDVPPAALRRLTVRLPLPRPGEDAGRARLR